MTRPLAFSPALIPQCEPNFQQTTNNGIWLESELEKEETASEELHDSRCHGETPLSRLSVSSALFQKASVPSGASARLLDSANGEGLKSCDSIVRAFMVRTTKDEVSSDFLLKQEICHILQYCPGEETEEPEVTEKQMETQDIFWVITPPQASGSLTRSEEQAETGRRRVLRQPCCIHQTSIRWRAGAFTRDGTGRDEEDSLQPSSKSIRRFSSQAKISAFSSDQDN